MTPKPGPSRPRPGHGGWPAPLLAPSWTARRAIWWLRLVRAGRVDRFHADLQALGRRGPGPLLRYADALKHEWRTRAEAGPAGPALARAAHPNYLGSRAVVRGLVDGYIALLIARAGGAVPYEACVDELHRLARIFAGLNPAYAVIGGWNTQDLLGAAIVRWVPLGHEPASLEAALQELFAALGLRVLTLLRAAEQSDVGADAALAGLSDLAETLAGLLLGAEV